MDYVIALNNEIYKKIIKGYKKVSFITHIYNEKIINFANKYGYKEVSKNNVYIEYIKELKYG